MTYIVSVGRMTAFVLNKTLSMAACLDVILIGHSYIRRLRDFTRTTENSNLRLHKERFNVIFRCRGGLTVPKLANTQELLDFEDNSDICYLQIGGNHLSDLTLSTSDISRYITSFASFLIESKEVKVVVIGQILCRQPWAAGDEYIDRVVALNDELESWCDATDLNIRFWHHYGFWEPHMPHLGDDGVHLKNPKKDARPMRKYLQSIKSAILKAARDLPR